MNIESAINSLANLPLPQQREIVARLLARQSSFETETTWRILRFDQNLRVAAYAPAQQLFAAELRELLQRGALARIENAADGNWEIYGETRTFYATISERRAFVGLLDSWQLNQPPREIELPEIVE